MAATLQDKLAALDPGRRARIAALTNRLADEYRTLQKLRKVRELTLARIAESLGIRQASVAQMEKRSDLMLSTPRSYVEAMGGELRLTVPFPGQREVELGEGGERERQDGAR